MNGHFGTEIRPRLLREAAVGNIAQWRKLCRSDAAYRKKVFGLLNIVIWEDKRLYLKR